MIHLQLLWAWTNTRIDKIREEQGGDDAGFSTLEWVAITGVVVVAAIVVATILMNKAKSGTDNINVQ